jgi:glycosyltransferase involved in cell wall biosynthesis
MPASDKTHRVCILLGLYNGASDLGEQLDSLVAQTHPHWDLIVSDDGSGDEGPAMVQRFAARMAPGHRVDLVDGPRQGFAANFLSLIARAPEDAEWLALSDQDDVWLPERLARGITALKALPPDQPALYCSATLITDARLENRRPSARFQRPPGFRNALVQNIAAGNTILLNRAAAQLARAQAARVSGVPSHDWWLYQLITGCGGTVIRDPEPTLLYRQHGENLVGANDGWRARLRRISMLLGGQFADWNSANIAALHQSRAHLTPQNRDLLDGFAALRGQPIAARLRGLAALHLYRQGRLGQIALWLALVLRRL